MTSSPKRATIYDIAKRVGTSTATVSRVLSGSNYPVSDLLREQVLAAAQEMNYVPNALGLMLKKNENPEIGVVIPTLDNPHYTQVLLGIEREARHQGWNLLLCNTRRSPQLERQSLASLHKKQVRGVILVSVESHTDTLQSLQAGGMRFVLLDQPFATPMFSSVDYDFVSAGRMATEHLIQNGHRRIMFLSSPLHHPNRSKLLRGYQDALCAAQLPFDPELLLVSEDEEDAENAEGYEFYNGRRLAKRLLDRPLPDAVVAVNDMTALGVIQALGEQGIQVPKDLSVISFDNIQMSAMAYPPLTTIDKPAYDIGKQACLLLSQLLGQDAPAPPRRIDFAPTLILRGSVAPHKTIAPPNH